MEWVSQNWIWLLLGIGFFVLMRRGGMGCCGMGHRHQSEKISHQQNGEPPTITRDPVSGEVIDPALAVTSIYRERTYFFTSRENRERFEAEPEKYAEKSPQQAVPDRKHGGCC